MSKLAEYFFKPTTGGFTTSRLGISTLSHMSEMAKAHWYHIPYKTDFKKAYERAMEVEHDKRRKDESSDERSV